MDEEGRNYPGLVRHLTLPPPLGSACWPANPDGLRGGCGHSRQMLAHRVTEAEVRTQGSPRALMTVRS